MVHKYLDKKLNKKVDIIRKCKNDGKTCFEEDKSLTRVTQLSAPNLSQ